MGGNQASCRRLHRPYTWPMRTESTRSSGRQLASAQSAFVAHDPADGVLESLREATSELTRLVDRAPRRDRLALMQSRPDGSILGGSGFEDQR